MAFPSFKLRTALGTVPFEEIDISARVGPYEADPNDYDAKSRATSGRLTRVLRSMGRHFIFPEIVNLTNAEVEILRRWKMNRVQLCISPNWNETTIFYARYNRMNPYTGVLGSVYGGDPTFTRTIGSAVAAATRMRDDGLFETIAANIPRIEQSKPGNAFYPLAGIRSYGSHKNYFGQSHPKTTLPLWTLTNTSGLASYGWDGTMPRMVTDVSQGAGRFVGRNNPDYISATIASYDAASVISVGVWLRGEGTFSIQLTGGATITGADTAISPHVWTLLKVEGVSASGSSVTVRINAKGSGANVCAVGPAQFNASRRLLGYVHNVVNTTVYQVGNDDLDYAIQIPPFAAAIHVGLEMPDLYATAGEQVVLGLDQGGGNRLVLRYRADTNKFSFQKTSTGTVVAEWTPNRAAGNGTIISISAEKGSYKVYENGTQVANVSSGVVESIAAGLNVGWDGITAANGWNGLIYFVRVDSSPLDTAEISYISDLYNDARQLNYTKACEGRIFEITTPIHRMPLGMNRASLELEQVDYCYSATHEEP